MSTGNSDRKSKGSTKLLGKVQRLIKPHPEAGEPEKAQIAVLESISDARSDKQTENAGTRFFTFLKSEIIRAYYTSQPGLKELDFKGNGFYARSPGCSSAT